jgi:hypothetical protein
MSAETLLSECSDEQLKEIEAKLLGILQGTNGFRFDGKETALALSYVLTEQAERAVSQEGQSA